MKSALRWAALFGIMPALAAAVAEVDAATEFKSSQPYLVVATQLSVILVMFSALGGLCCVVSLAPPLHGMTFVETWNTAAPYFFGGGIGCFMLLEGASAIVMMTVGLPDLGPPQFYPWLVVAFAAFFYCVCEVLRGRCGCAARELRGLNEDLLATRCPVPRPSLAAVIVN
mmetsp:Transcript_27963/g.56614  ORF Transcript_27963/g.56614 Transcript_27963/m.56614 type:complete len:170 (-) Transcript_27963:123-632(-)